MQLCSMDFLKLSAVLRYTTDGKSNETICYNSDGTGRLHRYELIFIEEGESQVHYQNAVLRDSPNTVRFLPPRMRSDVYSVTPMQDGPLQCIQIFFRTDAPLPTKACCTNYSENPRIGQLFSRIYHIWKKKDPGYYNRSIALFYEILFEMEVTDQKVCSPKHAERIEKGIRYIHEHYSDMNFEYQNLAEICGISYTYFKRLFRLVYSSSPHEYIKNLRMKRARELLRTPYISVTEVASACGYCDIYYFSKVFKEENKCTPSEYRRLHQKNPL